MRSLLLPLLVPGLLAPIRAQTLAEGYSSTLRALPASAAQVAVVGNEGIAWFDGTRLVFDDGRGTRVLLALPSSVFGSFTVAVSPTELLFGESSNGDLWLVPFRGGGTPRVLANLPLSFDAVAYGSHALVSAKVGGFGSPDNEIVAVDLATGGTDRIAVVPGASGPLAATAGGDVLYGTGSLSFPAPPGSADVLRFPAAKVQSAFGPSHLTAMDASLVVQGLDAAGSLALDSDDDLFVVDWMNDRVLELSDIGGGSPRTTVLLDLAASPTSAATLQAVPFAPAPAAAVFEPFQPPLALALAVHESRFGSTSRLRTVMPARPVTATPSGPVPPGPVTATTYGGPRGGTGLVALAPGGATPPEAAIALGGFEQPLFWALGGASVVLPVPFAADGTAAFVSANPGFGATVEIAGQVGLIDAGGTTLGSAPPFVLRLQ